MNVLTYCSLVQPFAFFRHFRCTLREEALTPYGCLSLMP